MAPKFSFQNTLGAKDDMGACMVGIILSREKVVTVHKGSNDGSTAINPGSLGKDSSFFGVLPHGAY